MRPRAAILSAGLLFAGFPTALPAADPVPGPSGASALASMPPLPVVKSPTARFRELLAATPSEREALLARRSPAARALIESKLREFAGLRPDEREVRLRLAQLHDSLRPLLATPPDRRGPLMTLVAPEDLPLIQERLAAWDALSEDARRDLVESERQLSVFIRQSDADPGRLATLVDSLPPENKAAAEAQLTRWLALTPEQRTRKTAAFSRFFDLSPAERSTALQQLSEPELRQMERTLADFSSLNPAEREQCIRGFRKFEALDLAEREQFLLNAQRWKALPPNDRAVWRRLVGRTLSPPPLPPLPARESMLATTNR